jgi:2-hydroxychromene-2-carboxylate isomerase
MPDAEFFFDYSCPWTYLASARLKEATLRTGTAIVWRPILVERLFEALDSPLLSDRSDPSPRKAAYHARDLQAWARYCNLTVQLPKDWPVRAETAACGAIVADRENRILGYSDLIFRAYFEAGENIGELETVVRIAGSIGLEPGRFVAQVQDSGTLAQVRANTDALIERGGFGSPTIFVGEEMYFGNDRIPLVEFALAQSSGRTFVMPGQHG